MSGQNNQKIARECLTVLRRRFPKCFFPPHKVQPLKIGILDDLFVALKDDPDISRRKLRIAIRYYAYSKGYLSAVVSGAKRCDLQGNKAGVVTEEQAEHAKENLLLIEANQAAKSKEKDTESPHPEQW